jgi:hypothetical protein
VKNEMNNGFTITEQKQIMSAKKLRVYEAFKSMTAILESECFTEDSDDFNFFSGHDAYLNSIIIQFSNEVKDEYQHKILTRAVEKLINKA